MDRVLTACGDDESRKVELPVGFEVRVLIYARDDGSFSIVLVPLRRQMMVVASAMFKGFELCICRDATKLNARHA
jgi:hypothetical protein